MQAHRITLLAAVAIALTAAAGCRVVTDEELARIRGEGQVQGPDAAQVLQTAVIPNAEKAAHPAPEVAAATEEDFDAACKKFGYHASQAFPCAFWLRVQGKVTDVNFESRVGRVTVDAVDGDQTASIVLQVGPVIIGTGVRDATPSIQYSDFNDQTKFAEFGQQLNKLVVDQMADKAKALKVGDPVDVVAVFSAWSAPSDDLQAVPVVWP